MPLFVWSLQTLNLDLRDQASTTICWNRVVGGSGTAYWPDGCKGDPNATVCTKNITQLTQEELALHNQWVGSGSFIPEICQEPTRSPQITNPVIWSTDQVALSAEDFYIMADGKKFTSQNANVSIHSDPGNPNYTTLEVTWNEQGTEMRMYMYFYSENLTGVIEGATRQWGVTEIRTYDGTNNQNWLYYGEKTSLAPTGVDYNTNELKLTSHTPTSTGELYFKNLKLRAFLDQGWIGIGPSPTPTATQDWFQSFAVKVRFAGVSADEADGAKIALTFKQRNVGVELITEPFVVNHIGNGIYEGVFSIFGDPNPKIPTGSGYEISVKGEKHIGRRFCQATGQTTRCTGIGQIQINASNTATTLVQEFDFTQLPLDPGDLFPQDGKADVEDFAKISQLLRKNCDSLSEDDKLTGDLDYSGCVNVRDAFLMRKSLETRYDEI